MFVKESKAHFDVNTLYGKVTHLIGPENRKGVIQSFVWGQEFHVPFWSMFRLITYSLVIAIDKLIDAQTTADGLKIRAKSPPLDFMSAYRNHSNIV